MPARRRLHDVREQEGGRRLIYRVEGIVIRSTDYGEGNKIVTLLTDSAGKAGIMARGAKRCAAGTRRSCSRSRTASSSIFATPDWDS